MQIFESFTSSFCFVPKLKGGFCNRQLSFCFPSFALFLLLCSSIQFHLDILTKSNLWFAVCVCVCMMKSNRSSSQTGTYEIGKKRIAFISFPIHLILFNMLVSTVLISRISFETILQTIWELEREKKKIEDKQTTSVLIVLATAYGMCSFVLYFVVGFVFIMVCFIHKWQTSSFYWSNCN